MSNVEAVLFDLDGVIADSEPMWNEIDAEMLAPYGVIYTGEHKTHVIGKSFQLSLDFYKEAFGLDATIDEMLVRRTEIAKEYYTHRIPAFDGAAEVLRELREMGLKVSLATSSVGALVLPFLERHDLRKYFDAITTGEEVVRGKPSPDIYLRAAEKIGVSASRCVVAEDALAGIAAGRAAGALVAAIPDPRFVDTSTYVGAADFILLKLTELPGVLRKLMG